MRSATLVLLLALGAQTHAKDLLDNLVQKLYDSGLSQTDLDNAMLGKPSHVALPGNTKLVTPYVGQRTLPVQQNAMFPSRGAQVPYCAGPYCAGPDRQQDLAMERSTRWVQAMAMSSGAGGAPVSVNAAGTATKSLFADVPTAPADSILKLATMFKEDTDPRKVNLGIGAYRTPEGKPWILPSVKAAEEAIAKDATANKEYQPIDGQPEYKRPVQELIFTPEEIDTGTVVSAQCLSGTGGLQIVSQFMVNWLGVKKIYIPDPTWGNHPAVFKRAGIQTVEKYPYWDPATKGLDFDGWMAVLEKAQPGEVILVHAVAHNPTGVDPTEEQWKQIVEVCKKNKLIPFIDNAYQGYASGDLAKDGLAQNLFAKSGLEYFITQSFAKNFGLYGERIGYIHVKTGSAEVAPAVLSQLKILIRQAYSSPPRHGAAIVNKILSTPDLKKQWLDELNMMSNRIVDMRGALRKALEAKGTPGTWNHVTDQIGMFTYTGLAPPQVERMVNEFHIYMTGDGRISVAGLNPGNVDYVAECIDTVVRG